MAQNVFKMTGFQFGATWIPISSGEIDSQVVPYLQGTGASVAPTMAGLQTSRPILRITTPALSVALTTLGIRGATIATTATAYFTKVDPITYASGTVHKAVTVNEGIVVLRSITASQDNPATAVFEVYAITDGDNDPLEVTTAALPEPTVLSELFYCGPASLGASEIEVDSITYNSGIVVRNEIHSGLPFPTFVGLMAEEPEVNITTHDAGACVPHGEPLDGSYIFFRKASEATGGRVGDTVAEHVKITLTKAFAYTSTQQGDWRQAAVTNVILRPRIEGANAVAILNTAAAITVVG